MNIANSIRIMRIKKGMTQKELAEKAGCAEITIQQYESGERIPRAVNLNNVCDALQVSAEELLCIKRNGISVILRRKRLEKKMSQRKVAELIGISQQAYCQYETGKRNPKYKTCMRIAQALDMDVTTLLETYQEEEKMSIKRNASGYYAPTAYTALKNVLQEVNEMEVKRGDVVYIKKSVITTGSEQFADRPAVIVSNDIGNKNSECVEIVYLTTQKKAYLPTHVQVVARIKSVALCEQIYTVSKERIKEYIRSCTDAEMKEIDKALAVSVGLSAETKQPAKSENRPEEKTAPAVNEDIVKLQTELNVYKQLYADILERMVGKTA